MKDARMAWPLLLLLLLLGGIREGKNARLESERVEVLRPQKRQRTGVVVVVVFVVEVVFAW